MSETRCALWLGAAAFINHVVLDSSYFRGPCRHPFSVSAVMLTPVAQSQARRYNDSLCRSALFAGILATCSLF
jgi:hypothetical protein